MILLGLNTYGSHRRHVGWTLALRCSLQAFPALEIFLLIAAFFRMVSSTIICKGNESMEVRQGRGLSNSFRLDHQ